MKNLKPKRPEIQSFGSWDEMELIAAELDPRFAIPVFAAGTGLRPEEWIALERRDLNRAAGHRHRRAGLLAGPTEAVREDES